MERREAASSSLTFFTRVAPLARQLGMSEFPAFEIFSSRFHETEDINTDLLRADGQIVKQVQVTAVAQVDHQREQDGPLTSCWPDGSGVVARQQLRAHLPRADADVAMLGDVAAGLLVAADCIDVARLAKFTAIATISPDTVLGMPIGYWIGHKVTSVFANCVALRAAITASVNLFGSAVDTCDQAVEAVLCGVCECLAGMDTSEYPVGGTECPANNSGTESGGSAPGGSSPGECSTGVSGTSSSPVSAPTSASPVGAAPVAAVPSSRTAPAVASGAGTATSAFGPTTTAAADVGVTQLAGLLGPMIGVVGQALTVAVTGLVEAVAAVRIAAPAGPPGDDAEPVGPASITVGDKTIEITRGTDGASVSLTVREAGSAPDTHILDVRADGGLEVRDAGGPQTSEPGAEEQAPAAAPCPEGRGPGSADGPLPASGLIAPPPDASPGPSDTQNCPPPVTAGPTAEKSAQLPHPSGVVSRDRGAQVAPQSSATEDPPVQGEGVLALAGDQ